MLARHLKVPRFSVGPRDFARKEFVHAEFVY